VANDAVTADLCMRLHTAARRYCDEQYDHWADEYWSLGDFGGWDPASREYTEKGLATFPRYQVIDTIRVELMRHTGRNFASLDEARELFVNASGAWSKFTETDEAIFRKAMDEEREKFAEFVSRFPTDALYDVDLLPFKRTLTEDESKGLRARLLQIWSVPENGHWYPLSDTDCPDVMAFEREPFAKGMPNHALAGSLERHDVSRIYELWESSADFEVDVNLIEPGSAGFDELIACSGDMDWIIYVSHESTITIGGWLLADVKRQWPGWERHKIRW
jgi:hypothetical protein